jgi:Tfp pilus assembly protein PilX
MARAISGKGAKRNGGVVWLLTGGCQLGHQGIALLMSLLIMMILAIIGLASITVTGVENRLAGYVRSSEAAQAAAESCLQAAVRTIEAVIRSGEVPTELRDTATPPGPVPNGNAVHLHEEVSGAREHDSDALPASYPNFNLGVPSPLATLNNFTVQGDIDRLQINQSPGSSLGMFMGYEGLGSGTAAGGLEILYRVTCLATHTATNTRSTITAIYACKPVEDGCLRKI